MHYSGTYSTLEEGSNHPRCLSPSPPLVSYVYVRLAGRVLGHPDGATRRTSEQL